MPLRPGSRLGACEIVGLIGAGGMGEVYRAKDTRLKRDVAIKVLPEAFINDLERLARFQREAELLATLNHPHIAQIYALEDRALVLELVDGTTLADRIAQGPIPLDEALPIAKQIADALEAAHERGVIHRDLKPANIKLTRDGKVKVLDFGLAKALVANAPSPSVSLSPTITSPAMTGGGVILGTAAYMSPEQARGRAVDKRTDVWAFGCVFFEMLTAKRAFDGDDVSDALAAVLRAEPNWTVLPGATPQAIRRLLKRCLAKDPRNRLADIADARLELEDANNQDTPAVVVGNDLTNRTARRSLLVGSAASLILGSAVAGTTVWLMTRSSPPPPSQTRRFVLAEKETLASGIEFGAFDHNIAISPDGNRIAYVSAEGRLSIRSLERLGRTEFPELGNVRSPFFSPDGRWVGYFSRTTNELKRVPATGGPPMTITTAHGNPRGATWGSDGTIVFSAFGGRGLWRVSSGGGKPEALTNSADSAPGGHVWPHFLPESRAVLFTEVISSVSGGAKTQIAVLDLKTGNHKVLIESGSYPQYLSSGHLLYSTGSALFCVAFDSNALELRGEPVAVLEDVQLGNIGLAYAAISNNGTLVYLPGTDNNAASRFVVWLDRQGREAMAIDDPQPYAFPRVSPDGNRIALYLDSAAGAYVLVHDLIRKTSMRLTFSKTADIRPTWTPDGRAILFRGEADGLALYRKASDGSGQVEKVTPLSGDGAATSFSSDGRTLIFNSFGVSTSRDIWAMNLDDKKPRLLISEPGSQGNAVLSPNGRWLAYSDETEGYILVTTFPDVTAGRWQVSPPGSKWPLWSRDGRELFYVSGPTRTLMALPIEPSDSSFKWGTPKALFPTPYAAFEGHTGARNYDLSPDGSRFVVIKSAGGQIEKVPFVVVENWFEELKQRVPVN